VYGKRDWLNERDFDFKRESMPTTRRPEPTDAEGRADGGRWLASRVRVQAIDQVNAKPR